MTCKWLGREQGENVCNIGIKPCKMTECDYYEDDCKCEVCTCEPNAWLETED